MPPYILGAVAYDRKVVDIWETFKALFALQGFDFDYILFSNYEKQVEAQLAGLVDVAWNSPLAWIETERICARIGRTARAIAMRDSDCDLTSVVVVRADSGIHTLADLRGRTIAVGASDSPQATLIPLQAIREAGVDVDEESTVLRHEIHRGKHGDHVGGEREAALALMSGKADAACLIDGNHLVFAREGVLPATSTRVLAQTAPYDHCNFTVLGDSPTAAEARFVELLLAMSFADPAVRPALEMEGLKQWLVGRVSGYAQLDRACTASGEIDRFVEDMVARFGHA